MYVRIVSVFEPESVAIPQAVELVQHESGEELARACIARLQHPADKHIDVIYRTICSLQILEYLNLN